MFVKSIMSGLVLASALLIISPHAHSSQTTTINIQLKGLQASDGKLYLSIQTEDAYMSMSNTNGGIYEIKADGERAFSYTVPVGEYAISVWHDIDNDGQFSLNENWIPTDRWASSGSANNQKKPSFDEVKTMVGQGGASITLLMIYPSS